jgi:hypothetical protein
MKFGKRQIDDLTCPPTRRELVLFDDDVKGLGLRVTSAGAKVFMFEYWRDGHTHRMRLGPYGKAGGLTHVQARKLATALRGQVAVGRHPAEERKSVRRHAAELASAEKLTFAALVDRWERDVLADRRPRYRGEAVRALRVNFAVLSARPANAIDAAAARRVLEVIGKDRGTIMARRSHAYARAMFGWAKRRDLLAVNPFDGIPIEGRETPRERVLTDAELGEIWRAATALGWPYGDFIRFLLLTLQREAEAAGLQRSELADDLSIWELPGARAKNGKPHIVHLTEPARAIVRNAPRVGKSPLVFTTTGKRPIDSFGHAKVRLDAAIVGERAKIAAERDIAPAPLVPWRLHDLRRTGVTTLARLGIRWEVADKLLNHVHGAIRGVAAIYQRHEFLPERRAALEAWSDHVLAVGAGKLVTAIVVQLRA